MITTVTTTTVSTVTTIALTGSLALVSVLALLVLLTQRELGAVSMNHRIRKMAQVLNVLIAPLLIAFILIVVSKVAEALH